jgi:putative addiction module killer protein
METKPRILLVCQDDKGREPILEWIDSLDKKARARIRVRIDRLEDGNLGDVEPVGDGISELRLDFGPGYLVYFAIRGDEIHLMLDGAKKSQRKDIQTAKELWKNHE